MRVFYRPRYRRVNRHRQNTGIIKKKQPSSAFLTFSRTAAHRVERRLVFRLLAENRKSRKPPPPGRSIVIIIRIQEN